MTCYLFAQTCSATAPRSPGRSGRLGICVSSKLFLVLALTVAIALFIAVPESWAHRVNVYAYVESDRIVVEGYFGGKARAANCTVSVHDAHGNKIAEGRTDDKGACVLRLTDAAPAQGDLKVILVAGQGHKAEYTVKATDRVPSVGVTAQPQTHGTDTSKAHLEQASRGVSTETPEVSSEQIATVVNQALDEKMKPILRMLGQQQRLLIEQSERGPGLREIIGGVGWIFGLVGVAAYFMSRRRSG